MVISIKTSKHVNARTSYFFKCITVLIVLDLIRVPVTDIPHSLRVVVLLYCFLFPTKEKKGTRLNVPDNSAVLLFTRRRWIDVIDRTFQMAASATTPSACNGTAMSNHLSNFIPCQYTLVATKAEHGSSNDDDALEHTRRAPVPRVCRLRSRDNTMAIYAIADPIGPNMLAADVCANMLVEYLSKISFDDESYREEIEGVMQKISFEIENRLLQMTFDHAEEKVTSDPSSLDDTDKLLPSLEEAESGAFLCATAVTQSYVYIAYVGTSLPSRCHRLFALNHYASVCV